MKLLVIEMAALDKTVVYRWTCAACCKQGTWMDLNDAERDGERHNRETHTQKVSA